MKLISHRGNTQGIQKDFENKIEYIENALRLGYEVEVDLRMLNNSLYLGHDEPQVKLDLDFLEKNYSRLWLHCKDVITIEKLHALDSTGAYLNYFWHENDTMTITSKGYLWAYPGKQPITNSIAVLPELHNDDISNCYGICSDVITNYKIK